MDTDLAQLKEGQVLGKDFKVLKPLAAGGMGAVYLVEQLSTGRERALKIMHPQFVKSPDSRARFTQEAKVGARIRSDHVVEVVSAGVDDDTGIPWLAMELLDGEELAKRIQRKKFLPPSETLEIFRQLCHALGEAHKNGLVHRDLKPQNIFMARSRRQGEAFTVKILDFGVAKLVQEQQGEGDATKPVGTPRWMAPEQSDQGAAIRPATDVWALGLIAFNCLTGKFYWRTANAEKANLTALLRELVIERIDPASQRAAEMGASGALPRGFDEWFSHCVDRDHNRRYQDANAALAALVPVLERAPAWKPANLGEARPDDSVTTPVPFGALTNEAPVHTPQPPPSPTQKEPERRSKAGLIAGIAGGLAVLAIAGVVVLRKPATPPPPAAPVVQPLPEAFTVVFDSFPSGAEVYDADRKIGSTPMQTSLRNAGLDNAPRKFRIVRDGFLPYEVMQGQSREPVRVLATLAVDPAATIAREKEKEKEKEKDKEKAVETPKKRQRQPTQEEPELRTRR